MGQQVTPRQPPANAVSLKPITALVDAPPDAVCMALLRYAANPASMAVSSIRERTSVAKWAAQQLEGRTTVIYLLQEGPFAYMRLQFAVESDESGSSVLWVTGEYAQKKSLLHGALERRWAQRDALSLREGVLEVLKAAAGKDAPSTPPGRAVRGAERLSVRAPAHLFVGDRSWRAEVLDVSETGIALVAATVPHQADADAQWLLAQEHGEIEVLLQGARSRVRVVIKRATPGRGGVQVGLQVVDAERLMPLIQRAMAKAKAAERQ